MATRRGTDRGFELNGGDKIIMACPQMIAWALVAVVLVGVIMILAGAYLAGGITAGIGVFLSFLFHSTSWREIYASGEKGPEVALVTILGKRKEKIVGEGWHLFAPFLSYSAVPIRIKKINKDVRPKNVRTLDGALIGVGISYTYGPDYTDPRALIEWINSGEAKGAENILDDPMGAFIRAWARRQKTWGEAMVAQSELEVELVSFLTGETDVSEVNNIREKLGRADGRIKIRSVGAIMYRFNFTTMELLGGLAKDAETQAREAAQAAGEQVQQELVEESIKRLVALGISADRAAEIVQVERGKATKQIIEYRGLKGLDSAIAARVLGKGDQGGKRGKGRSKNNTSGEEED